MSPAMPEPPMPATTIALGRPDSTANLGSRGRHLPEHLARVRRFEQALVVQQVGIEDGCHVVAALASSTSSTGMSSRTGYASPHSVFVQISSFASSLARSGDLHLGQARISSSQSSIFMPSPITGLAHHG